MEGEPILSDRIEYISENDLEYRDFFTPQYYWTESFSPQIYIALAKKGFISVSCNLQKQDILLPEMQSAYAVLDFKNLRKRKKLNCLLKSDYSLKINKNLDIIIPKLIEHHGKECWLTESYIKMLYKLLNYSLDKDNFELATVLLYSNNTLTAGEIGYFIGKTYTSLTGFFNRNYKNWGSFQLFLLGKYLEERGLDFWNLGHPYMDYKLSLGAKILENSDFLNRWSLSTQFKN